MCRDKADEYPASVIQYRSQDALKVDGASDCTIIFLKKVVVPH